MVVSFVVVHVWMTICSKYNLNAVLLQQTLLLFNWQKAVDLWEIFQFSVV